MLGAVIGDIVGSRFETHPCKNPDFELFTDECRITDDTVMTVAIAKALMECGHDFTNLSEKAVYWMRELGREYPDSGYGDQFKEWLSSDDPKPYNSFGNGAAMRVSPCGIAAESLEEAKVLARDVTEITHNHPDGLKGAEATAVTVYLARSGMSREELRAYITQNYYPLDFTLEQIRDSYDFAPACSRSVPQAMEAFFEAQTFEESLRNAVMLGGDSDTIAAITGSIAKQYFNVPQSLIKKALTYVPEKLHRVVEEFEEYVQERMSQVY